jgi:hypothetical protein
MERRMAALFLLALGLIVWQALRTKPVLPPAFEFATKTGEQISPLAVPSWREAPALPGDLSARLAFLQDHAIDWPGVVHARLREAECRVFVRISAQHWAVRPASPALLQRWLGSREEVAVPWRLSHLAAAAFLDDDDGDGDPLDAGELTPAGPEAGGGAEVEAFCGAAARTAGGLF